MPSIISSVFLFFSITSSTDVPGYIIMNSNDTIRGTIIYTAPNTKGKMGAYETDTSLVWKVKFTSADGKKAAYKPKEIKGFGIEIKNTWYHYVTITPSKAAAPFRYEFFGRRILDGSVEGYVNDRLGYFDIEIENMNQDWWFKVKGPGLNGFIYDLFSVKKKKLAEELEVFFQMEKEFLETLPDKIEKEKVYKVVRSYNEWKKNK